MRPIGAFVFGLMADRYGRRLPLMIERRLLSRSSRCSRASRTTYRQFIVLRVLFGIGMGGEWGVGASLAMENASPRMRGLLSGLLQEGYAIGNLLAALASAPSIRGPSALAGNGWRVMFFLGGLPALLALFIRMQREGIGGVARAPHATGPSHRADRLPQLAACSSISCC